MIKEQQSSIKGYGLDFPSAHYAINAMGRFMSKEEAGRLWGEICQICSISPNTDDLTELELAYKELSKSKGSVRVLGRSLVIRIVAYRALKRKEQ